MISSQPDVYVWIMFAIFATCFFIEVFRRLIKKNQTKCKEKGIND